jgi:hypothetical protein
MSLQKQLSIRRLPLPTDMLNAIKDYCFYNIEEVTKKNKKEVIKEINSAHVTRANRFNDSEDYSDEDPYWCFGFDFDPTNMPKKVLQLQAIMCVDCGEYRYGTYRTNHGNVELIRDHIECKIRCKCFHDKHVENYHEEDNLDEAFYQEDEEDQEEEDENACYREEEMDEEEKEWWDEYYRQAEADDRYWLGVAREFGSCI